MITYGITSILVGAIAGDGGPGTSLAALGKTFRGSGKMNQSDPTVNQFFSEENDAAELTISTPGEITFAFSIMDPDPDLAAKLFGGTATGTSPNKVWNYPASFTAIEQTVKINTKQGMTITIPRGSIVPKMNGELTRENPFMIDVTVTALAPTKTGVGQVQFTA